MASLPPQQVEGERWRAEAREGRRGLPAEREDRWSSVAQKAPRRGRWPAMAPPPGQGVAEVCGRRQDTVCLPLRALWQPVGLPREYPDSWGAYGRQVATAPHRVGQAYRHRLASQPSTLRTRRKRRVRRTSGCSKTEPRHALVRGLFVNRDEVGCVL